MKMNLLSRVVVSASLMQASVVMSVMAQDVQMIKPDSVAEAEVKAESEGVQVETTSSVVVVSEPQVVTQPTTVVEDTPLVKSRAEQLRNARQGAEIETEQKIVEKLEEARLSDEQKRMNALFGNKLEVQKEEAKKTEEPVKAEPIKVEVIQQAPQQDPAALKAEITESVKADLQKIADEEKVKQEDFKPRMSVNGGISFISYNAINIRSDFAGGFGLGYEFRKRMELEFGFMYSRHLVQDSIATFQEFDQYNVSAGLRYGILPTFVRPVVGASMSYTRRAYSFPYWRNSGEINTNAIDMGFMIGAEADLGKNMTVSVEYRRLMNLQNNIENNDLLNLSTNARLEDLEYDVTGVSLRFLF